MKLRRREFMHRTALGLGGLMVAAPRASAAVAPAAPVDPFALVPLGKTPLKVSRFCLGTGMRGGGGQSNHTRLGKERFEALIRESFDRGTRLFDLADSYGSHPYVVPALKGISRDRYQIVTKIGFFGGGAGPGQRPDADATVERFLRELRTDFIDLLLLLCMISPSWPTALRRQMDLLSGLKEKGVIRALGVSCHSIGALEAAAAEPWVESVHARINPFGMSMDGPPDTVVPVLQRIHAAGKGVIGMKIVCEGRLRDDPARLDESVRYALSLASGSPVRQPRLKLASVSRE